MKKYKIITGILVIIICVLAGGIIVSTTMNQKKDSARKEDISSEKENSVTDDAESDNNQKEYSTIKQTDGMEYLVNSDGMIIAGPYKKIYVDELGWYNDICRYEGKDGLIGYLSVKDSQIQELSTPKYSTATQMTDGKAKVQEPETGIYYINSDCERISEDYKDGVEYEHQGCFARVLLDDGKYGIINWNGQLIFQGADEIEPIPEFQLYGSAVIDGKACLLYFPSESESDNEVEVTKTFAEYTSVSEVYFENFMIAGTADGKTGVIDLDGNIVVPAEYKTIDYTVLTDEDENGWFGDHVEFTCTSDDGSKKIIKKDFR